MPTIYLGKNSFNTIPSRGFNNYTTFNLFVKAGQGINYNSSLKKITVAKSGNLCYTDNGIRYSQPKGD